MCTWSFYKGVASTLTVILAVVAITVPQFSITSLFWQFVTTICIPAITFFNVREFIPGMDHLYANTSMATTQIQILKDTFSDWPGNDGLPAALKAVSSSLQDTSLFLRRQPYHNEMNDLIIETEKSERQFYNLYSQASADASDMYGKLGTFIRGVNRMIEHNKNGNFGKIEIELSRICDHLKESIEKNERHIMAAQQSLGDFKSLSIKIGETLGDTCTSHADDVKHAKRINAAATAAAGLIGGLIAGPTGALIGGGLAYSVTESELRDLQDYYETLGFILNQLSTRVEQDIEINTKFINGLFIYVSQQKEIERESQIASIEIERVMTSQDTQDLMILLHDLKDVMMELRQHLGSELRQYT